MNEITQNIKFTKSRLNWDVDESLLPDGDSRYALNTVPEDDKHAGVRSNCLGSQNTVTYLGSSFTNVTVTTTSPTTSTKKFEFTLASVPSALELAIVLNGELRHVYLLSTGYSTLTAFNNYIVAEIRKRYEDELSDYGVSGTTVYFTFYVTDAGSTSMETRTRGTASYPTTLKVIGAFYDKIMDCTYIWTNSSSYTLLQYVNDCDVLLNMQLTITTGTEHVYDAFAVGTGKSRMLYWCYTGMGTYKINIYNQLTNPAYPSNLAYESFLLKRLSSATAITVTQTGTANTKNASKYFLALARGKFIDGERSVFTSLSHLIYPQNYGENSVGVRGALADKTYSLTVTRTNFDDLDAVEYAVKAGNGNWELLDLTATVSNDTIETVTLTGNEPSSVVAPSDISKPFDYVPQKHSAQCFVGNNRLLVADCVEGYDNVDLDATVTFETDSGLSGYPTAYIDCAFTGSGPYEATVTPLTISATEWRTHCIYLSTVGREYYAYVVDDYGMTQANLCDALSDALTYELANTNDGVDSGNAIPSGGETTVSILASTFSFTCRYIAFRSYAKDRTIKLGAWHYFGVVYKDSYGRSGGVNPLPDAYCDRGSSLALPGNAIIQVNNDFPSWATSCQVYYGGSSIKSYKQAVIKREDIDILSDTVRIYIGNYVVASQIINPASQMASYVFTPGDKFVFIGYKDTDTSSIGGQTFIHTYFPYFSNVEECDILSQDETYIYVRKPSDSTLLSEIESCTHCMIELYTPRTERPLEYFETPYYLTEGGSVDVALDHWIEQTFYIEAGIPVSTWMESESFSNYFESKTLGTGRVNLYNEGFKKLRRNIVRASNVYIPNTNINGLSTFDYDNEVVVDESYGFIKDLKVVGDVLKIIQPRKISSMYIGAEVGVDANGNTMLLNSDKVLTTPRYGNTDYGSMHPESVVVHNNYLYFLDAINSTPVRDTPGGTFSIANGMASYFKEKIRTLIASCGYSFRAIGGYDYKNEMYLLTFIDPYDSDNNETIGFHEPSESWYSFYSFLPEAYCGIPGDYMLSFYGGELYTHDYATRNNFYGTQYHSEVWVHGNIYPDDTKKFNSIVVNSNDKWYANQTNSIIVDEDSIASLDPTSYTTHSGKMQSMLFPVHFRYVKGEFRADLLRDLLTTDPDTVTPTDLHNGRTLDGKTILVKLRNETTTPVYLKGVRINAQIAR